MATSPAPQDEYDDQEFASDDEEFVVTFRTPEEEDASKRRPCRARCKSCCGCFWCWKVPVLFLPLTPVILINAILVAIFLGILLSGQAEVLIAAVALRWWTLALLIAIDAAILARLLVGLVYLLIEVIFSNSARIFYYVNELGWPIAAVIEGGLCLLARTIWLSETEANVKKALDIIFIMIMVLAAARILQILIVKLIISVMNSQRFWEQVAESLFRQRVLLKLLANEDQVMNRLKHSSHDSDDETDPPHRHSQENAKDDPKLPSIIVQGADSSPLSPRRPRKEDLQKARLEVARERLGSLVSFKKIRQLYRNHRTQMHLFDRLPKNEDGIKLARMRHAEIRQAAPGSSAYRISAEAKIDGNIIFEALDIDKKGFLVPDDLKPFFKGDEKRKKAFKILQLPVRFVYTCFKLKSIFLIEFMMQPQDKSKISRKEVVKAVSEVYKEREKLVASLRDRQSVAGVLSKILGLILFVICIIIFVTLLGVDWLSIIAPFGTAVLAISFVFGSVASSAFKSIIFLVFVNPYDIGDRITAGGMTLKVAKISLLSTSFFTPDGKKVIMSNAILADDTIINHTRSRDCSFGIDIEIHSSTPAMKIALLRHSAAKWLKINRLDWDTDLGFWVSSVSNMQTTTVSFWITLVNTNWGQVGRYLDRKSEFLTFIKETMQGLEIEWYSNTTKVFMDKIERDHPHTRPGSISSDDENNSEYPDNLSETHSRVSASSRHMRNFSSPLLRSTRPDVFSEAKRQHTRILKNALDAVKLISPGSTTPPAATPAGSSVTSPTVKPLSSSQPTLLTPSIDDTADAQPRKRKKKVATITELKPIDSAVD